LRHHINSFACEPKFVAAIPGPSDKDEMKRVEVRGEGVVRLLCGGVVDMILKKDDN